MSKFTEISEGEALQCHIQYTLAFALAFTIFEKRHFSTFSVIFKAVIRTNANKIDPKEKPIHWKGNMEIQNI